MNEILKNFTNLNINYINNRIQKEICFNTIDKLKDKNLMNIKNVNQYKIK